MNPTSKNQIAKDTNSNEKKCNFCENRTNVLIHSLADVDWSCVMFEDGIKTYACPNHKNELHNFIIETLRSGKHRK